jgi:signal transduction histidine kinase
LPKKVAKKAATQSLSPLADPDFVRVLLERLGQSAVVVLDKEGHIVYSSKRAERLLDISERKTSGKSFFDVVNLCDDHSQPLSERKNPVHQALVNKDFNQMTPFFCKLNKNNTAVPVAVRALQIIRGRNITGVVVEMREIKRVLNVGEMKSLFVSFAAHQLKTPSSIVKGFLELMMREGPRAYQKQQWYNLQSAFEANESLIHLSKTLLSLTRLEGGLIEPKIVPFDPVEVLRQKIKSHELLLQVKQLKVDFKPSLEQAVFPSDEMFFSEIFEILFSNAIKYSPANSTITLTCVADDVLEVEVSDEGEGISEEDRERLFRSMGENDPEQNSHGLGLLMAKKYVSLLGGTIGLRPKRDKGSTFYFSIPKPIV